MWKIWEDSILSYLIRFSIDILELVQMQNSLFSTLFQAFII